MPGSGCSVAQKPGRSGLPNRRQPNASSRCTQGMPAGLPWGMPGSGVTMDGAMQHAPQPGRQSMGGRVWRAAASVTERAENGRSRGPARYSRRRLRRAKTGSGKDGMAATRGNNGMRTGGVRIR